MWFYYDTPSKTYESYLCGAKIGNYFKYFYLATILLGSVTSLTAVVSMIDFGFGIMAFPNMVACFLLAPTVMRETKKYFASLKK